MRVALKNTVVGGDWCFDNLSGRWLLLRLTCQSPKTNMKIKKNKKNPVLFWATLAQTKDTGTPGFRPFTWQVCLQVYILVATQSDHCLTLVILLDHPYFVGVQYHPEYISRPVRPSPPYLGLILAAIGKLPQFIARGCRLSPRCSISEDEDEDEEELAKLTKIPEFNL